MNELRMVKQLNGQAGKCIPWDMAMDGVARFGHLAFVAYGLWLWFGGRREERTARRAAALTALLGVVSCSLLSFAIGRLWKRPRPFARDGRIWNFTGHRANAAFPSNHTMNGAVVSAVMLRLRMPGAKALAALTALLGFSRIYAGIHYPTDVLGGAAIALLMDAALLRRRAVARGAACLAASYAAADRLWRLARRLR